MEASALTADRMPDGSLRALSWFGDNKGTTEALHAALGRGDTIEQRKGGSTGRGPGADFVSEHVRRVPTSGGAFILSSGQLLLGAGGVTGGWLACKAAELQRPRMGGPGAVEPYHGFWGVAMCRAEGSKSLTETVERTLLSPPTARR